jgi:hypothetical protein
MNIGNKDAGEGDTEWITVNGAHVPIKGGKPANKAGKDIFQEGNQKGEDKTANSKGQEGKEASPAVAGASSAPGTSPKATSETLVPSEPPKPDPASTISMVAPHAIGSMFKGKGAEAERVANEPMSASLNENVKLRDNPSISATGANTFKQGFSQENLDQHWNGGYHDHSGEYPGYAKEQYAQEALALVQSATSDTVYGYKNNNGQVIRFDSINGNFVKGHPEWGIATMFKPIDGAEYYYKFEEYETNKEK